MPFDIKHPFKSGARAVEDAASKYVSDKLMGVSSAQAATQSTVTPNDKAPPPPSPLDGMISAALAKTLNPLLDDAQSRLHGEAVGVEKETEALLSVALYTLLGAGAGAVLIPLQFPLNAVVGAGAAFYFTKGQTSYL